MAHAYTESQLVEQPAIGLFAALGWQTVSARGEILGSGGLSLAAIDQGSRKMLSNAPEKTFSFDQMLYRREQKGFP